MKLIMHFNTETLLDENGVAWEWVGVNAYRLRVSPNWSIQGTLTGDGLEVISEEDCRFYYEFKRSSQQEGTMKVVAEFDTTNLKGALMLSDALFEIASQVYHERDDAGTVAASNIMESAQLITKRLHSLMKLTASQKQPEPVLIRTQEFGIPVAVVPTAQVGLCQADFQRFAECLVEGETLGTVTSIAVNYGELKEQAQEMQEEFVKVRLDEIIALLDFTGYSEESDVTIFFDRTLVRLG